MIVHQVYKRPGAADFIYQMGQYYEIVIYTDETNMYADPIINRLDPYRVIPYRLYRQDTQYVNGKHVRDLSKLNRDPSQVMFLSGEEGGRCWWLQTQDGGSCLHNLDGLALESSLL